MGFTSRSEAETQALGERLARTLKGGEIVLLSGDLGAGKTQFAKGFARGLDVAAEIVSPTFTLAVPYSGRLPLVHYDLYRLEEPEELRDIGFLEADDAETVFLVEWGDRLRLEQPAIRVELRIVSETLRHIQVNGLDSHQDL